MKEVINSLLFCNSNSHTHIISFSFVDVNIKLFEKYTYDEYFMVERQKIRCFVEYILIASLLVQDLNVSDLTEKQ